jgi:hypothetical protein
MSRIRCAAAAAALSMVVALVVASPASATSANLGPVLGPLPSRSSNGGPGTAALNSAVSGACQGGATLAYPRWFTLPAGGLGTIWTQAWDVLYYFGRDAVGGGGHTAVVDYETGTVLSCSGVTRTGTSEHLAVVAWLDQREYDARASCAGSLAACGEPEVTVYVAPTTGVVPANDRVAGATTIAAVPYLSTGDRTLADDDGPLLLTNEGWLASQMGTVWFRYTAAVSGRVPIAASGGAVGVGLVTADGVVRVDTTDGWTVRAGATYLLSVSTPISEYDTPFMTPAAGAYLLSLGGVGTREAPPIAARASTSGAIHVEWTGGSTAAAASGVTLELTAVRGGTAITSSQAWGVGSQQRELTGLVAGAEYSVLARLRDAQGFGATTQVSVQAGPPGRAGEPTQDIDVSIDSVAGSGRLTWTQAPDWPSTVTGYRVSRDGVDAFGAGPWSTTVASTARSFTFTHLARSSTYRFTVTALTDAGDRPDASVVARVLPAPTVPGRELGLAVFRDTTGALAWTARWDTPSDGQSPITGYRVTRSGLDSGGGGPLTVDLPTTTHEYTLGRLLGPVSYTITVRAVNAVGLGPIEAVTTEQLAPDPPTAPTGVTAAPGDGSVRVTWKAPSTWGSLPGTGYTIAAHLGTSTTELTTRAVGAATTSLVFGELENGTGYSFTVRAENQGAWSPWSARTDVVVPEKPPAPVISVPGAPVVGAASGSVVSGKVRAVARWAPPVSDGGSPVLAYRVYAFRMSSTGTVLSTTVSPRLMASYRAWTMVLPVVGRYRFAVRAANAVGYSTYSARSNLMSPARVPTAPRIGLATSGVVGGTVTATARWLPPLSTGGTVITAYRVYAFRVTSAGTVVSYTMSPLLRSTTRAYTMTLPRYGWYRFAVRAVNAMGYSPFSAKSARIIGR